MLMWLMLGCPKPYEPVTGFLPQQEGSWRAEAALPCSYEEMGHLAVEVWVNNLDVVHSTYQAAECRENFGCWDAKERARQQAVQLARKNGADAVIERSFIIASHTIPYEQCAEIPECAPPSDAFDVTMNSISLLATAVRWWDESCLDGQRVDEEEAASLQGMENTDVAPDPQETPAEIPESQ